VPENNSIVTCGSRGRVAEWSLLDGRLLRNVEFNYKLWSLVKVDDDIFSGEAGGSIVRFGYSDFTTATALKLQLPSFTTSVRLRLATYSDRDRDWKLTRRLIACNEYRFAIIDPGSREQLYRIPEGWCPLNSWAFSVYDDKAAVVVRKSVQEEFVMILSCSRFTTLLLIPIGHAIGGLSFSENYCMLSSYEATYFFSLRAEGNSIAVVGEKSNLLKLDQPSFVSLIYGNLAVLGDNYGTLTFIDLATREVVRKLSKFGAVSELVMQDDHLCAGTGDGCFLTWKLE
jgi:hypothetical protein